MFQGAEEWARESTYGKNTTCNANLPGSFAKNLKKIIPKQSKLITARNQIIIMLPSSSGNGVKK